MRAVNPATGELLREYPEHDDDDLALAARPGVGAPSRTGAAPGGRARVPAAGPRGRPERQTSPPTPRS